MGEERLATLAQESLAVAVKTGAAKPADFTRVLVDTTVQEKVIAFPTDAKLMHTARERLVRLAKKAGVDLRQSYARAGKHALTAQQRYAQARQFNVSAPPAPYGLGVEDFRKRHGMRSSTPLCGWPLMMASRVSAI